MPYARRADYWKIAPQRRLKCGKGLGASSSCGAGCGNGSSADGTGLRGPVTGSPTYHNTSMPRRLRCSFNALASGWNAGANVHRLRDHIKQLRRAARQRIRAGLHHAKQCNPPPRPSASWCETEPAEEGEMAEYRLYQLDAADHIVAGYSVHCISDRAALAAARRLAERAPRWGLAEHPLPRQRHRIGTVDHGSKGAAGDTSADRPSSLAPCRALEGIRRQARRVVRAMVPEWAIALQSCP